MHAYATQDHDFQEQLKQLIIPNKHLQIMKWSTERPVMVELLEEKGIVTQEEWKKRSSPKLRKQKDYRNIETYSFQINKKIQSFNAP